MWPKIKFGAQIFVLNIEIHGQNQQEDDHRTTWLKTGGGKQWLLKDDYEMGLKCLKEATDKGTA